MPLKPGTPRQIRYFAMLAHDPAKAKAAGISMGKAREMLMTTSAAKRKAAMRSRFARRKRRKLWRS